MTERERLLAELRGLERRDAGDTRRAQWLRTRLKRLPAPQPRRRPRPVVEHQRVVLLLLDRNWVALEAGYEKLTAYQQQVLDLRYGLRPGWPAEKTVAEVAAELDRTARSVQMTERRAIARLAQLLDRS